MYRAIICIEEGFGALTGPNPVFRTEQACEDYWLSKWYQMGPVINSFRTVRTGPVFKDNSESRVILISRMLKAQQNLNGLSYDEATEMLEEYFKQPTHIIDAQIAVIQDELWNKKYNRNKVL